MNAATDGINHINAWSKGRTDLGRYMSNYAEFHFTWDGVKMRSVEQLWFYLLTGNVYAYNDPAEIKQQAKGSYVRGQYPVNFFEHIDMAITLKLQSSNWAMEAMRRTANLEITHRVRGRNDEGLSNALMRIRAKLLAPLDSAADE